MEPALCEVCKDVRLGKILIQTNLITGEPEVIFWAFMRHKIDSFTCALVFCFRIITLVLCVSATVLLCQLCCLLTSQLHYLRLPRDIKDMHVMLMDATVATGAAAMMAVRVLLDHDVPEENIMLLSLIMAGAGARACSTLNFS